MQRVEQKLAEWRAVFALACETQSRFQRAVSASDFEQMEQCLKELDKLNTASQLALNAVHAAVAADRKR